MRYKLFPNTPIQIVYELGAYAVYTEGQWYCNSPEYPTNDFIDYIITRHINDWLYTSTRINPTWTGWHQISMTSLIDLNNAVHRQTKPRCHALD